MDYAASKDPLALLHITLFLNDLLRQLASVQQNLTATAAYLDRTTVSKRDLKAIVDLVLRLTKITCRIIDCKNRIPVLFNEFNTENSASGADPAIPNNEDLDWKSILNPSACLPVVETDYTGAVRLPERCSPRVLNLYAGEIRYIIKLWCLAAEATVHLAKSSENLRCLSLETEDTSDRLVHNIRGLVREIRSSLCGMEHALGCYCSCFRPCSNKENLPKS